MLKDYPVRYASTLTRTYWFVLQFCGAPSFCCARIDTHWLKWLAGCFVFNTIQCNTSDGIKQIIACLRTFWEQVVWLSLSSFASRCARNSKVMFASSVCTVQTLLKRLSRCHFGNCVRVRIVNGFVAIDVECRPQNRTH